MYDGGSMTTPIIGKYCSTQPPTVVTTSNEIFVHFETNFAYTDVGFRLMYKTTSNQH